MVDEAIQIMEHTAEGSSLLRDRLAARGYWPARAAKAIAEGRYSDAVGICREYIVEAPGLISGRLLYGSALQLSGLRNNSSWYWRLIRII